MSNTFFYNNEHYKTNHSLKTIINHYIKLFEKKDNKDRVNYQPCYKYKMNELDELGFGFKNGKTVLTKWLDICCAPGYQIKYIKNIFPKAKFVGITLPERDLGFKMLESIDKSNIIMKDITKDVKKTIKMVHDKIGFVEYVNINCVANHLFDPSKLSKFSKSSLPLYSSLCVGLSCLKKRGNMFVFYTLKNPYIYTNLVYILTQFFKTVEPTKLRRIYQKNSSIYLKCSNYVENKEFFNKLDEWRKNNDDIIYKKKLYPKEFLNIVEIGTEHGWKIQNKELVKILNKVIKNKHIFNKVLNSLNENYFKQFLNNHFKKMNNFSSKDFKDSVNKTSKIIKFVEK